MVRMSHPMKNIVFVTGTRADFGKLQPLAEAASESQCAVTWFTTGMHMLEKYGLTKLEVHKTGHRVVEFINQRTGDPQEVILSKTLISFADFVVEARPDAVVLHGDRIETLACALVCAINNIRCIHVEGGEVSGTLDESLRHCVSKLAHFHLVSSEVAKSRLVKMGESTETIHVIGSPEMDLHLASSKIPLEEVRNRYEIGFKEYGICIFHPVTTERSSMETQAQSLFGALTESGRNFVVIAPNNDPGSDEIFAAIETLDPKNFRVIPSMRFGHFSSLMWHASIFVGNSSAGIREAPFLGIPSLNIGSRQSNRALTQRVAHCTALDKDCILNFISTAWGMRTEPHKGFGDGRASQRFNSLLSAGMFDLTSFQKNFVDT
jgi:UDP-N-acetylglucosamine 2-epimerase (hydrolysing)